MRRGRAVLLSLVLFACGDDDHVAVVDAGAPDARPTGPIAVVRTVAPSSSLSLPGPRNATFALAQNPGGTWSVLTPFETGSYAVPFHGDRWTAIFVCADEETSYVNVFDRAATLAELSVELPQPCVLDGSDAGDLTGTFAHAPPATSWFDFGYIADERGSSLPLLGDTAEYEIVNIVKGKWDLLFGFRDDSAGPLTKLFIARDAQIETATVLDGDLGTAGIVPGSKALTITGATADEQLSAPVIYGMAEGPHGIDMGPQTIAGPNLTYSTVPPEQQRPADKYRVTVLANAPDDSTLRGANAVFHDAVDVAIELAPAIPPPVFTTVATTPYIRLSMKTTGRANTGLYELTAATRVTDQKTRRWIYTTDADAAEIAFEMPDFSSVPGWNNAWSIQGERTTITATVREKAAPLSDGAITRFAASTVPYQP